MNQHDQHNTKANSEKRLDVSALENYLWDAACVIRGPLDAPKFKDYILPLVFLKRLSDVFEDEIAHLAHEFGTEKMALKLVEQDHKLVRFYIPEPARWPVIATRTTGLEDYAARGEKYFRSSRHSRRRHCGLRRRARSAELHVPGAQRPRQPSLRHRHARLDGHRLGERRRPARPREARRRAQGD